LGLGQNFGHRPMNCSRDRAAPVVFLRESGALWSAITVSHPARALCGLEGVADIAWEPYTSAAKIVCPTSSAISMKLRRTLIDRPGGRIHRPQPFCSSVSTHIESDANRVPRRPVSSQNPLQQDPDRLSTISREALQLMPYSHRVPEVV
jgi:hypothetical protein